MNLSSSPTTSFLKTRCRSTAHPLLIVNRVSVWLPTNLPGKKTLVSFGPEMIKSMSILKSCLYVPLLDKWCITMIYKIANLV